MKNIITTAIVILLSACTNQVVVKGDFPNPLLDKLPITVGVYFNESIREHKYTEQEKDRGAWIISTGDAQISLFNTVFPAMFQSVTHFDDHPQNTIEGIDLLLSPAIEEFQYAVPRETKINVYEVWIKYNMRVYDAAGNLIADWIMTAYGKTPTAMLRSRENAMNQAVIMALRDAGTNFALQFSRKPEIQAWIEQYKSAAITGG